jgi:hypothetical protein
MARRLGAISTWVTCVVASISPAVPVAAADPVTIESAQVPKWSAQDKRFFLHGSMSTEVFPERVLAAFRATYPDLLPGDGFTPFGLIPDSEAGMPVGFSRREVDHLGGLPSIGLNCAACHVAELKPSAGGPAVRVLGVTSHFDAEAFFGAVTVATFRTAADPANMEHFLLAYLAASDPAGGDAGKSLLETAIKQQHDKIASEIAVDPGGGKGVEAGGLQSISPDDLRLDAKSLAAGVDLARTTRAFLRLFHNMRAALHIPDKLPDAPPPPPSGPGRNDAFGLLSLSLFGVPTSPAPVKYGLVWNLSQRAWVHWDGNTRSPLGRNLLAALGLGAPLIAGHEGKLDFAAVKRHTELSEQIHAPKYPWAIDEAAAKAGAAHYQNRCASCHDVSRADEERRLFAIDQIGTDPTRAREFTPAQAARFDKFFDDLRIPGSTYEPPKEPPIRSTQRYWAADLAGVWARSPYLHNGSVRTMADLLTAPAARAKSFHRGSRVYDALAMGYTDEGPYLFDEARPGNSNAGHDYGTDLSERQKRELTEFLKTK